MSHGKLPPHLTSHNTLLFASTFHKFARSNVETSIPIIPSYTSFNHGIQASLNLRP